MEHIGSFHLRGLLQSQLSSGDIWSAVGGIEDRRAEGKGPYPHHGGHSGIGGLLLGSAGRGRKTRKKDKDREGEGLTCDTVAWIWYTPFHCGRLQFYYTGVYCGHSPMI